MSIKNNNLKHQYLVIFVLTLLTCISIAQAENSIRIVSTNQAIKVSSIGLDFVEFSPDGNTLASANFDGQIMLWDVISGQVRITLPNPFASLIRNITFSPDGNTLASVSDNSIQLWDISSNDVRLILSTNTFVSDLVFSPDSKSLATVNQNSHITIWNVQSGSTSLIINSHQSDVNTIAFSSNSRILAIGDQKSKIKLWDITTGFKLTSLIGEGNSAVTDLLFSPDGKTLIAVSQDFRITLWNVQSRSIIRNLPSYQGSINTIVFSPYSTVIVTGGQDAQIKFWDVETGRKQSSLVGEAGIAVTDLVYSPDGKTLASLSKSKSIFLWDVSNKQSQLLTGHIDRVIKVVFNTDQNTLVSVDQTGQVIVWNLKNGLEQLVFHVPFFGVSNFSLQEHPPVNPITNTFIATQSKTNRSYRNRKTVKKTTVSPHVQKRKWKSVTAMAISPNGKFYGCANKNGVIQLWDAAGKKYFSHSGHHGTVATGLAFSADGKQIISVGRDTDVQILDVETGKLKQVLRGHGSPIRSVATSSDHKFIATAGEDTRIMLWNAKTGKLDKILSGHIGFVNNVIFSRNGKRLATAGADGRILLWNVATGKLSKTLLGHRSGINTIDFSPNGKFLASGGTDKQVILWEVSTGQKIKIFTEHQAPVKSISFHPNGKRFVSAGEDAQILVWSTKKKRMIKQVSGATNTINVIIHDSIGRLVVGDEDGQISEWDIDQGKKNRTINVPVEPQVNNINPENISEFLRMTQVDIERKIHIAKLKDRRPSKNGLSQFIGHFLDWVLPVAEAALPGQGPGGPILVVTSNCPNCGIFNNYYAEILLNEGLNAFSVADISTINAGMLTAYDVVVLASMPLSALQTTLFSEWVNSGGNLIAMRPDTQLAGLLGLIFTGTSLTEGYLLVDTSQSPGNGIVNRTMQFHGTADRYTLNGASSLAALYTDMSTATTNPALTINNSGLGQAAAFTYDLATSIVYTRQGNPAWEAEERDGLIPIRSDDKFFGNAIHDPQPDWVDLTNNFDIPQADEQQRLLVNLILQMNLAKKPLPRFWYFPRGEKAVIVMTGDDHANNGTEGRFDQFLVQSPPGCSVADWECVRGTSYIFNGTPGFNTLTDVQAATYTAQGFEVGLHITTSAQDYTKASLETVYTNQINLFTNDYPSIPAPLTMRHHAIVWSDWITGAEVQLNHDIRLDTSYYYWPPEWVNNRPGYFNGTAMPMRFASLDGSLIDVYQATTQLTDESGQIYPFTVDTLLDYALGAEGYYGAYVINAHTDVATIPESTLTVQSAQARGVPIISSVQLLTWLDARNASSFNGITWNGNTLDFTVTADISANGLQAMVPVNSITGQILTIINEGSSVNFNIDSIKGMQYAFFTVATGNYTVTYGLDGTLPEVVSNLPADGSIDITIATTIEATFSEAINSSTILGSNFELKDSAGTLVTTNVRYDSATQTAKLTPTLPLSELTTYTATIKGGVSGVTDIAGNALVADVTWSFTTAFGPDCPCSTWDNSTFPITPSVNDPSAVELGVKFTSDLEGSITGIRFYQANIGSYIGNLWDNSGQQLATVNYTTTTPGWQQVDFSAAVGITANTVYVASYYAANGNPAGDNFFFADSSIDNGPIHLLQDGISGGNGLYKYSASSTFPTNTFQSSNYWVDVVFDTTIPLDDIPPTVTAQNPLPDTSGIANTLSVTATFSETVDAASINETTFELRDPNNSLVPATITYDSGTKTATLTPIEQLALNTTYSVRVVGGLIDSVVKDLAGNALTTDVTWSFTTHDGNLNCPCSAWDSSIIPITPSTNDSGAVELGIKFTSDFDGSITGIRFYQANIGSYIGNLWDNSGQQLATANYMATAPGWQQVDFSAAVGITANTVYVASYYAANGNYAGDSLFFANSGISNTPINLLQDGISGGNGLYKYSASSTFPTNTFQSSNYWVDVVFDTTIPLDIIPPTVTAQNPLPGATGIANTLSATVRFSETVDAASINETTFKLLDPNNSLVPATITYDSGTKTATLTPIEQLALNTTYSVRVVGGVIDPTVKDIANNVLTADVNWVFTTSNCSGSISSIWSTNPTPSIITETDTSSVELGVKFRSDLDGFICGIRFYKGSTNHGTHVGSLWTDSGQLLASGTFQNETTSGWQLMNFGSPVAITAGSVYVASYLSPEGRYSSDKNYFSIGNASTPLYALSNDEDGGNGLYLYGSGGFPTNSFQSTNYWVDVVFTTTLPPDTTPPTVTSTLPMGGVMEVNTVDLVQITFNEAMDSSTIDSSTFELRDSTGNLVVSTITYNPANYTATLNPSSPLAASTTYTATLRNGIKDPAGNVLATDFIWSFTTDVDPCLSGNNPIVCENSFVGNPASEWDVVGAGDLSIQGFATDISVNRGETVRFKIDTPATNYRLDIYRMGYYGGDGARKLATIEPSASLPQSQPSCMTDSSGLVDCGNWTESASWTVPLDATSGIYFAKAIREDGTNNGASHIIFIVRDDSSTSDILFQTSDTSWQAYNNYGGNSLYEGSGPGGGISGTGRAYKVSYNRPFVTRNVDNGQDWVFNAEYPMIRWLEANGYNVSYFTGIDSDRQGALISNHKVFLSVGHDEFWSQAQRTNVEIARDAGVHLAFFSGNEVFWKIRWENSIDASGIPNRTLVCYKETHEGAKIDPLSNIWTGTWRDPRFSPPADGGRPENELTGTIFLVNAGATTSITVPEENGKLRFWRNTSISTLTPGSQATLPFGTLGYEWDEDLDNGFRPAGLIQLSSTTVNDAPILIGFGSTFGSGAATHALTLYRATSGALVFGAGTVQWSWGLDSNHDRGSTPVSQDMQQATVNLFADMGIQPDTLEAGLQAATESTDLTEPTSVITTPIPGANISQGTLLTIQGTANDTGGGQVGGVEVSVDGGLTWNAANGQSNWTYAWTVPTSSSTVIIKSRAVDDSLNLEIPGAGITVNVGVDTTPPTVVSMTPVNDTTGISLGTSVTATFSEEMELASITSLNFQLLDPSNSVIAATINYNGITATLTPTNGLLASNTLYTVTLKGGAGGVEDLAGNPLTSDITWQFSTTTGSSGSIGANCTSSTTTIWSPSATPTVVSANDSNAVELGVKISADVDGFICGIRFYKGASNTGSHVGNLWSIGGQLLATATFTNETDLGWQQVSFSNPVAITANTTYVASYHTAVGGYSADGSYFAGVQQNNSPLHALESSVSGGNGVYTYGSSGFPFNSYNSSNYWVDVVFSQ